MMRLQRRQFGRLAAAIGVVALSLATQLVLYGPQLSDGIISSTRPTDGDAAIYLDDAEALSGKSVAEACRYRPPGYPLFLSAAFLMDSGRALELARLFQIFVVATIPLVTLRILALHGVRLSFSILVGTFVAL